MKYLFVIIYTLFVFYIGWVVSKKLCVKKKSVGALYICKVLEESESIEMYLAIEDQNKILNSNEVLLRVNKKDFSR